MKRGKRRSALTAIVLGGLAAGAGDGLFALVFYGALRGVRVLRIFQSVASGLLGRDAFAGGLATFSIGLLLHFIVATCIAAVYYLVSLRFDALIKHPVICGLIYGIIAYLGMNYLVIPLSAARHGQFHLSNFVIEMMAHAFLVGLPIALVARRSAFRNAEG